MPTEEAQSPSEIATLPLVDLVVPPWNPRPFVDPVALAKLTAYIERGGQIPRIVVWKGNGTAPYAVISGQRRLTAYEKLEKTHIDVEIMDISLEDAQFLAISSNNDDKPYWLGEFMAVGALEQYTKTQIELAARLGWTEYRVSCALSLMELLSTASKELIGQVYDKKIRSPNFSEAQNSQNATKAQSWVLTEAVACELIPLLKYQPADKVQDRAYEVVSAVLTKQMTGSQTADLVAIAVSGQDMTQFEPTVKPRKQRASKKSSSAPTALSANLPQEPSDTNDAPLHSHPASAVHTAPEAQQTHKVSASIQPNTSSSGAGTTKASASAGGLSTGAMLGWDLLAGIPVAAQIRAKIKKGERPTWGELFILLADFLYRGLHWLSKAGWKLGKWFTKALWKLFKESIKDMVRFLGPKVRKTVTFLFGLAILCGLAWGIWDIHEHGYLHPFKVVGSKVFSFWAPKPEPTPVAAVVTPVVTAVVPAPVTTVSQVSAVPTSEPTPVPQAQVIKPVPSPQAVAKVAPPTQIPTAVKKGDAFDDLAGAVSKQAVPDAAANAAKKLFGF